jgi:hypothetical protein
VNRNLRSKINHCPIVCLSAHLLISLYASLLVCSNSSTSLLICLRQSACLLICLSAHLLICVYAYPLICVRQSAYLLTPVCLSTYASLLIHIHPAIPHVPLSNTVGTSADVVYLLSRGSKPLGVTPILHICLRQTASLVSKLFPVLKLLTLKLVHFRAIAALTDASHQARFFHHA